jgi:PAS domain S-box-containing protein
MHPLTQAPTQFDSQLFQAMPGNSALLLPDAPRFTIVAVTDDYIQTSGLSKEELVGKGLFEAFPKAPGDEEHLSENGLRASLEYVLTTKQFHRYDIQGPGSVFEDRYWSTLNKPLLNESGEVLFIIHSAKDITQQIKSEQNKIALAELNKKHQELLTVPVLMCIFKGDDNTIYFVNEQTLNIWGRSTDIIGQPLLQALPELKEQGFHQILDEVKEKNKVIKIFETPVFLHRYGKKEKFYLDFVFQPYFENDTDVTATGIICVAHNVTEQVQIRQRFQNVLGQAPDPILILMGEDLVLEVANQALLDLWQVGPEAMHKPFLEILPEMRGQVFVDLLKNVLHTGEHFQGNEVPVEFKRKNGELETRYMNFLYQPYHEADKSITGVLVTATDVTGQVIAKKQIEESEKHLRNTILQAPVAMCIVRSPKYVVEVANDSMFKLWGKSAEGITGNPIFEAIPELSNQGFEELLAQVYSRGESFSASEIKTMLPRGNVLEEVYINFVYEPLRELNGSVSGVIAVAIDVTEQVGARKKVEESVQEVHAIVDSAPFPIGVYTGKEMRIRLANQSIIDVWGKGPDVIGKTYSELLPELQGSGIYKQLDQVYTTGIPFHARNQRVDLFVDNVLQPFYFNYSFTPLYTSDGSIYGVMNTAAEITDLHQAKQQVEQSERNFRSMILQAPVAMCILIGPEHVVDIANDAMIDLWGKSKETVMNRPVFDALPDARNQGLETIMKQVYETAVPFYANEHPVDLLRNGKWETVYQNFVYQPYFDAEKNILGVLAISINVTNQVLARQKIEEIVVQRTGELAAANEELVSRNTELRRLNTNLEEFSYAASHDLKEPIRKIHFFSDRLKGQLEGILNDEQKRIFERLEHAARRMASLVDELLAYSQSSKGLGEEEQVDLNRKVDLVLEDLELEIQQRHAKIIVDYLPTITGSKRQMQQLFQNLITNSLKYSKPGIAPLITITSKEVEAKDVKLDISPADANKTFYLIEVQDNGIGFPQQDAERIFNVFTRLHGNTEYRGTGVGLSIVQKVVQNHGGYIWAEGAPGEGAVFRILLPTK